MAEPISLASGLLTLATFAFQSSITLYKTIQSFQYHPKRVRDLSQELEALSEVLGALTETAQAATDVDFSALDRPLLRCGEACKQFEEELLKCSSRSGGNRTSFRDWAKLKYMGDDIDHFSHLIAGYKSTINIALADASLRKASLTSESLEKYRDLIKTATDDLQEHLQNIDEKLEAIFGQAATASGVETTEIQLMQEERLSAQQCLRICAQLSEHIDKIQPTQGHTLPEDLISEGLQDCKSSLALTAAKLERLMRDRVNRLVRQSQTTISSEEDRTELLRLQDEWETARECIEICSTADVNLKQNVATFENYGHGDAVQFTVSTDGKVMHGKNKGLGWKTRQIGGYLSDASLQKISGDMLNGSSRIKTDVSSSPSKGQPTSEEEHESASGPQFKERYGPGFKLPKE